MSKVSAQETQIRKYFSNVGPSRVDSIGDLNLTDLVEEWDQLWGDGSTTDPDHIAWAIAAEMHDALVARGRKLRGWRP